MTDRHIPKFQQIINLVIEKITSGEWPEGHKLPSQKQWETEYGYTYGTLRTAYMMLKHMGYITGLQGQHVQVNESEQWSGKRTDKKRAR